jgi:diguanylate cyclase (GGDEF)-like protein
MTVTEETPQASATQQHNKVPLRQQIEIDQLLSVRRSVLISMPVNMILGILIVMVSAKYDHGTAGIIWFAASSAINLIRVMLCQLPLPSNLDHPDTTPRKGLSRLANIPIPQRLRLYWIAALISGIVWACLPFLSQGHTTPQTLFYIALICGVTAGAVVHGSAYARIPLCFITPALLSLAACLFYVGGFDRNSLGVAALLYLFALSRSTLESEVQFRKTSQLKNEATTLAQSLREAHDKSIQVAEEMRYRAAHDSLTGLLNRNGLAEEFTQLSNSVKSSLCMMLLDLDGFKAINDRFGHKTGDLVLVEVARRFRAALPETVLLARIGGDEFAALYCPHIYNESPENIASRLIASIETPFTEFDASRLGVSIGIYRAANTSPTDMLVCADAALYAAKERGRNRYHVFDEELRARVALRRDIERDLASALATNALEVWYQPVFEKSGMTLSNLEALVRWNHPKHGHIDPPDLITGAAMAGFAEDLTRFIFGEVCKMIQALQQQGYTGIRVALNMSPREMSQLAVDEFVLSTLHDKGLPPSMLEIEITEETAINIRDVHDKLSNLSRAGVRIAIDDFGVGYSSLSALRELCVDRLKIDHCFIANITSSPDDQALVHAVLNLGKSLGLEVVAEGVETQEDLAALRALGCQIMQGYYLARPMPFGTMCQWLDEHGLQNTLPHIHEPVQTV